MKTKDERKRIVLVDDDPAVLASLRACLGIGFMIVAACASGEESMKVLPALPAEQQPDLVLLDIKMPGMSGIQSCDELRRLFPTLIIAMHTARPAQECFEKARQAGADAYFVKGLAMELLVGSMHQLQRREGECVCIAPKISGSVSLDASKRAVLSPENERVMRLLSHGSGIKQIAEQLALHEQTVKWHLAEIRRKLRAGSNPDAVRIWVDGP